MSVVLHTRNLNTRLIHKLVQHVLLREFSLRAIHLKRNILEDLALILRSEKKKIRQRNIIVVWDKISSNNNNKTLLKIEFLKRNGE